MFCFVTNKGIPPGLVILVCGEILANEAIVSKDLSWNSCISTCMDEAQSMSGSVITLSQEKKKYQSFIFIPCFLHWEDLGLKPLAPELQNFWNGMINLRKSTALKYRSVLLCTNFSQATLITYPSQIVISRKSTIKIL